MDWDEIKYFLAVAQSGNLSAAARRLGVSQPTVGRKIRQLESKLDARLFERVNHDHVLTASGESILGLAESMEQDIVLIERRDDARDGETVVAIVEGEATLKRLYRENGGYRLQPANQNMKPIRVPEVEVRGVVIGVVRRY